MGKWRCSTYGVVLPMALFYLWRCSTYGVVLPMALFYLLYPAGPRYCWGSVYGGVPCWSTLLLRFSVLAAFRRHKFEFVQHLPDSSRVWYMTSLSEFWVRRFQSLLRVMSVSPDASLLLSTRLNERFHCLTGNSVTSKLTLFLVVIFLLIMHNKFCFWRKKNSALLTQNKNPQ